MMILLYIAILAVGFVCLIKGADLFVDGASSLARIFKVSGAVIGLTVAALGTSAPELAVSTSAALKGANEIALSNVLGSNVFNLLVVLGICAAIKPLPVDKGILKRDFPVSIIFTGVLMVLTSGACILSRSFMTTDMTVTAGNVTRLVGIILSVCFVLYIIWIVVDAKKHPAEDQDEIKSRPLWKCILLIIIGLIMIVIGGQAVVISARELARAFGMTETLIGLTVVALGTSLPELVTSIVAARKGETGLAVGNVVGSNIFNLLFILGVSSSIHPIAVNMASLYDMAILIVISLVTYVFCLSGKKINRAEGIIMVLMYSAHMVFAALR